MMFAIYCIVQLGMMSIFLYCIARNDVCYLLYCFVKIGMMFAICFIVFYS